jgi:hypothetical protein
MILHGLYKNGKIKITDKDLPDIESEVEIIFSNKPWKRSVKQIEIEGKPLSQTIIEEREEEI